MRKELKAKLKKRLGKITDIIIVNAAEYGLGLLFLAFLYLPLAFGVQWILNTHAVALIKGFTLREVTYWDAYWLTILCHILFRTVYLGRRE